MTTRKQRKAEQFRSHVNELFVRDLDLLQELFKKTFNITLVKKGQRALVDGRLDEYAQVILELKSEALNITLDVQKGVVRPDELDDEPVSALPVNRDNIVLRPTGVIDIALKSERVVEDRCDPSTCTTCEPLGDKDTIGVDSTSVVLYAGPGSGKTSLIKSVPPQYRGNIYDTDHMRAGDKVPPYSLVLTNRPDVLVSSPGLRLAFLPYKACWEAQCLTKCPGMKGHWFGDACHRIKDCFVVRRNCHLSDIVVLRAPGMAKRHNSREPFTPP